MAKGHVEQLLGRIGGIVRPERAPVDQMLKEEFDGGLDGAWPALVEQARDAGMAEDPWLLATPVSHQI